MLMIKKILLSSAFLAGLVGTVQAQQTTTRTCATDEMERLAREKYPEQISENAARWKQTLDASLGKMDLSRFAKTTFTANDTTTVYHIPLVFHIVHNYGAEFTSVTDNQIYGVVDELNVLYNRMNADTSQIIAPYKGLIRGTNSRYVGKTKFVFHLAQVDPNGQPTNGITRHRSYLTLKGGDPAKIGGWAPDSYFNIWVNRFITTAGAAAYAYQPSTVNGIPELVTVDGVMVGWAATTANGQRNINFDNTLGHEIGHSFSLAHTWGNTNNPGISCGDDGVFDTPPTKGHPPPAGDGCLNLAAIYDTVCTLNPVVTGKLTPDTNRKIRSTSINDGISFDAYSVFYLDTVSIYTADSGTGYTIQLTRNGVQTNSYSDTLRLPRGRVMNVPVRWKVNPGMGYTMSFAVNPGMYKDTNTVSIPYQKISGVVYLKNDTGARNTYSYFYNWRLRHGFFRIYDTTTYRSLYINDTGNYNIPAQAVSLPDGGFLVDYPDTVNSQNVMDYTYCSKMFTHGQSLNMRLAAASPLANRNNLSSRANLVRVGIMDANGTIIPRRDTRPAADFSLQQYSNSPTSPEAMYVSPGVYNSSDVVYKCTGQSFTFYNRTYGDTIGANGITWNFSNGATPSTITPANNSLPIAVSFSQPGWATVSLTATSNAGSDTETRQAVYVADANDQIAPIGYWQEFAANSDRDRWPMFNYYNNTFKWELANVGFYDNTSMAYRTYDYRYGTNTPTLNLPGSSPDGDFDDFFSRPFDLTGLNNGGNLNLNFYSSSASRTTFYPPTDTRDTFQVFASTDCGNSWKSVSVLRGRDLNNKGAVSTPFEPMGQWDWKLNSLDLRSVVTSSTNSILFRFRYRPGANVSRYGTGNNFFIDRIHVSNNPQGIDEQVLADRGVALAPNPTQAGTAVLLKNATGDVNVTVTDITGKVIYRTTAQGMGSLTTINIPAAAVAVKGIYLVQIQSSGLNQTEKLVVN
ncbi:MAG: T9SS type A sorting domain-containing protein [Sphingobacteriales bacterium]|nr:MAG: T9SS type A sorting domain-containing protein [Sphingobacteriales bacterium]